MATLISATLKKGKRIKFKVSGSSMAPFIKEGDVALISPVTHASIRLGSVLACMMENSPKLIIHRVIGIREGRYYLKGDNTLTADCPVSEHSILGQVSHLEKNGKRSTLSLGPEKIIIAFLSRRGVLIKLIDHARKGLSKVKGIKEALPF
jgi:signal peptidase I